MAFLRFTPRLAALGAVAAILAMLAPTAALAHERRAVGDYSFLVGFNSEPAIQGQPNGAQVTITKDGQGVEGLADALKATVAYGGGQPKEFKLRPVAAKPGQYVADFIPTRSGTYIFEFSGTIEGNPVDEKFESGPGRFNDVDAVETLQFPDAVPLANDAARAARAASDQAAAASADADSARTVAMAGVGIGGLGLAVGAVSLVLLFTRRPAEVARAERRS